MNKRITKALRLVSMALCIAMLAGFCCFAYADVISTEKMGKGYEWTRIRSMKELAAWQDGLALQGDKKYNTDDNWVRALLIYNGKYYVDGYRLDGSGNYKLPRVSSNEKFKGAAIPVTSGIDITKDTFQTRSGLNTPFIKFRGTDSDNNNWYKFAIRMSKADQMSKTLWLENLSWYGVRFAAAAYSEFRFCDYDNMSSYTADWATCSDVLTDVTFKFLGVQTIGADVNGPIVHDFDGAIHLFYNIKGVADRCWAHNGGQIIESSREITGSDGEILGVDSDFILYLGYPCDVPVEMESRPVAVGETTVWDGKVIGRTTEITVPKGATLVIDGKCYNNGKITVNGGTLIIKGVLDMDIDQSNVDTAKIKYQFPPGSIEVKNNGLLYVENSGCILQRHNETGIKVTSGSNMIAAGSVVCGGYLYISSASRFESDYASFVGVGIQPSVTLEQTKYSTALLKEYKTYSGSSIFSVSGKSSKVTQGLILEINSAAYFNGGMFMSTDFAATNTTEAVQGVDPAVIASFWTGIRTTNINASVGAMINNALEK